LEEEEEEEEEEGRRQDEWQRGGGRSTAVVVGRVYWGRKPASLALEQWETWQPLQTAHTHTHTMHMPKDRPLLAEA